MNQEGNSKSSRKLKPRPKKYPCPMDNCEKAYSRPCLLEQHIRSHKDERPYLCTVPGCEKAFLRDSHLKTHLLSHSVEKPLYCSYCGKGFNTNQHLNRHERTHVPSVRCTYQGCEMAFRRASQLRKHVSDCHTFRKEHQCPFCSRQFDLQARLESHVKKSHANAAMPSYHCGEDGCIESFPNWQGLQEHVKVSHKSISCYCGQKFSSESQLADHTKTYHSGSGSNAQQSSNFFQDHYTQEWHCREDQCASATNYVFRDRDSLIYHYQQFHGFVPDSLQVQVLTPASSMEGLPPLSSLSGHDQLTQNHQSVPYSNFQSYHPQQTQSSIGRRDPLTGTSGLIERITGSGYDVHRRIMCPIPDCHYRFAREYDLRRHVKAKHPHLISDGKMIVDYKVVPESSIIYHNKPETPAKFRPNITLTSHTPHSELSPSSNSSSPASFSTNIKPDPMDETLENQTILPPLPAFTSPIGNSSNSANSQQVSSGTLQGSSILQRHSQTSTHSHQSETSNSTSSNSLENGIHSQHNALDTFLTHSDILSNTSNHIQLNISSDILNDSHHYSNGKNGQLYQNNNSHHAQGMHSQYNAQPMQQSQSLPVPMTQSSSSSRASNSVNSPISGSSHSQPSSLQPSRSHTPIYPQSSQIYNSANSGTSSLSTTPSGGSPYQSHNSGHNSPQSLPQPLSQTHHFQQLENRNTRSQANSTLVSNNSQEIDPMILNGSV